MPDNEDERANLVNRQLPEMLLSTGDEESMTRAPGSFPHSMTSKERAHARFAVTGNAVMTGGCGTLALESAQALLEHGLSGLALLDINPSQGAAPIDRLRKDFPGARIESYKVDVSNAESVEAAMNSAATDLGGIDVLCCFAGVVGCTHAVDMTAAEWQRTLNINCTGEFFCAQAAGKHMIKQGRGGSIVLVASISAHRVNFPQPQVAYNVSKSALLHLAHSLAAEWARYGIRVNTISPGYMDTILNEGDGIAKARKIWAERCPMGRMGAPIELTGPLVMLCSRLGGSYITGTDLVVDGGMTVF